LVLPALAASGEGSRALAVFSVDPRAAIEQRARLALATESGGGEKLRRGLENFVVLQRGDGKREVGA